MKSNKLNTIESELIDPKLNKVLSSLINITDINHIGYGTDETKFVGQLRNKRMCEYQSKLLNSYLLQPKSYLKLELDKLDVTSKATDKAIALVLSKDNKKGMIHIRTKYIKSIINVKEVTTGNINKNFKGSKKAPRPYYTQVFEITLSDDPNATFFFYISDGSKENSTKGFRFSFNPNRFNDEQLCAVFSHLDSVLGKRRYCQFINRALVTRIDIAINLPGVLAAFLICLPIHAGAYRSKCYPLPNNGIYKLVETIYLGRIPDKNDKTKNRASKSRIYDALINYLKNHPDSIKFFNKLAVTTRIEYELIPYQSKCTLPINNLEKCLVKLNEIIIVDPIDFYNLNPDLLGSLLKDKISII